jgi:hypothetical protein
LSEPRYNTARRHLRQPGIVRDGGNHKVLHNSGVMPRRKARGSLSRRENGERERIKSRGSLLTGADKVL